MKRHLASPTGEIGALLLLAPILLASGCAPSVNVVGVYFPGWLVSTVAGVAASYGIVLWLGRRTETSALADSGLFFLSLVVGIALSVWWAFFSGL